MNIKIILFFIFIPFLVFSQEDKRLALVIGNANYDKGPLKNPENDARLIAKTLHKLNFDTILATNLETRSSFLDKIYEYGDRRDEYNVGLVFYAGHAVQIGGDNYLLPTKENYNLERDIRNNGVNVSNIMEYIENRSDEVNILILDACRDNPYETQLSETRSITGGNGLAEIPPPTGSLIAFSTTAGSTAPDGDGENSLYTLSLAKYMMEEGLSIYDVFNEVRAEVRDLSKKQNKTQRPEEVNQLLGTFYFVPPLYSDPSLVLEKVKELKKEEKFIDAISILNNYNMNQPNDIKIITELGVLFRLNGDFNTSFEYFDKAFKIDDSDCKNNIEFANYYKLLSRNLTSKNLTNITSQSFIPTEKNLINKSIELSKFVESNCSIYLDLAYENLAYLLAFTDNLSESINYYKKLVEIYSYKESDFYNPNKQLINLYNLAVRKSQINDQNSAIDYYQTAYKFYEKNKFNDDISNKIYTFSLSNLGGIFFNKNDFKKSYNYYKKAYEVGNDDVLTITNLGYVSLRQSNFEEAEKYLDKSIEMDENIVDPVLYKSQLLHLNGKYLESNSLIDNYLNLVPNDKRISYSADNLDMLQAVKALNFYRLENKFAAISSIMEVNHESTKISDYSKFINAFILKLMFNELDESMELYNSIKEPIECWEFDCKYLEEFQK